MADPTVLPGNIVYPADSGLICNAFGKMRQFAGYNGIPFWLDDGRLKKLRRGFGRCLYRGLTGHRIWSLLCQTAYNLKKFFSSIPAGKIKKKSLIKFVIG